MACGAIEYKSGERHVSAYTDVLETKTNGGITCVWSGKVNDSWRFDFKWKFDWDELKNQGVDEITGYITVYSVNTNFNAEMIAIKITEDNQVISQLIGPDYTPDTCYYAYSLVPHYAPAPEKPDYDNLFLPSDKNDTILVAEGKKLHVSKAFLSYHSDFFSGLFSSNFKEGQMDEIPIEDVSYEDFALLLSNFYPNPVFPNDSTVEKILEMASRFMVSSVINIIEYHLLNNSKINSEKMLWMADEYIMPNLLEKCIRSLNTVEKAKKLDQSPEYKKLSDSAKAKALDRIMKLI
ncbi:hypothetical protein GCK72_004094 [Caenorhabditis remanei]|uniref:BTB domain-containing protein n=1 Tax=Caenorhabditis remanei TaxID=31234 RepID=A0A6A5HAG1_CAERE|nr:hypothetical protein GCK72_004094 [Caenorhabditis remanei]KAF1764147.1 hypothetical protein GCK72_004094 [Caenorhabditis remanei]